MGIQKSKLSKYQIFNSKQYNWTIIYSELNHSISIDKIKKIQAEVHHLKIKNNIEKQLEVYQFRNKLASYLVTIYNVEIQINGSTSFNCVKMSQQNFLKLYLQQIPYRLSDLGQISYPECLYVLDQTLKGAKAIFQFFSEKSYFFNDQMIGFNKQGKCKIWINQNFNSNEIQNQIFQEYDDRNQEKQSKIIENIFELVEWRAPFQNTLQLKKQKSKMRQKSFKQAIQMVANLRKDNYLKIVEKVKLPSMKTQFYQVTSQIQTQSKRASQVITINKGNQLRQRKEINNRREKLSISKLLSKQKINKQILCQTSINIKKHSLPQKYKKTLYTAVKETNNNKKYQKQIKKSCLFNDFSNQIEKTENSIYLKNRVIPQNNKSLSIQNIKFSFNNIRTSSFNMSNDKVVKRPGHHRTNTIGNANFEQNRKKFQNGLLNPQIQ